MTRAVVVDASAMVAVAFEEPEADAVAERLKGAAMFAPTHLKYELASVAWQKSRRHPGAAVKIVKALSAVLEGSWNISWEEVDHVDAVLIGQSIGISPYDAAYLWLAGFLEADLVTLDRQLIKASEALADVTARRARL